MIQLGRRNKQCQDSLAGETNNVKLWMTVRSLKIKSTENFPFAPLNPSSGLLHPGKCFEHEFSLRPNRDSRGKWNQNMPI
jgi:hypothetical protein